MWPFKVKNKVPDGYVWDEEHEITVDYETYRRGDKPWSAKSPTYLGVCWGKTKEEAIIRAQNTLYTIEQERRFSRANPSETFTIPPIRTFE